MKLKVKILGFWRRHERALQRIAILAVILAILFWDKIVDAYYGLIE